MISNDVDDDETSVGCFSDTRRLVVLSSVVSRLIVAVELVVSDETLIV